MHQLAWTRTRGAIGRSRSTACSGPSEYRFYFPLCYKNVDAMATKEPRLAPNAYSLFDILANVINVVHPMSADESKVSFVHVEGGGGNVPATGDAPRRYSAS